jgi:1-acyl-sn-glycerol-3-phosphate acyltransferase
MTIARSLLFNLWFFGMTAGLSLYGVVLRFVASAELAGGTAAWALRLGQLWARLGVGGARVICGITLDLVGSEHLPVDGPALIAAQHQSAYDTMVFLTLLPRPAYVLKQELARIPLFGPLVLLAGMIAIDRQAGAAALRSLLVSTDRALADDRQIIIFPEGTRVEPGQEAPLQPGIAAMAVRSRLPVIPVVTDSGQRWGRRSFRKLAGPIHMVVMPAIPAGLPRPALMAALTGAFREGSAQLVDKSVGAPEKCLPSRSRVQL